MDSIVIGTAGHIDHGKTTLIKALTSDKAEYKNPSLDRLPEERKREMTIDLGFSYLILPSGRCAEIIDVPGHERFIKNMLAGANVIDLALLVIDANEGVMAQTEEHLTILGLLELSKGIIVITKVDSVDEEQIQLALEDTRIKASGTFLQNAPIIKTSIITGEGLTELVSTIDLLAREIPVKNSHLPLRILIDRVFTSSGFGTIVTGTVINGTVKVDDIVEILPQKVRARVRQIETHTHKINEAIAGQRVGINLTGVKCQDIERGNCVVAPGYLVSSSMFDGRLNLLPSSSHPVDNNMRLRLHLGTGEFLARIRLLDKDILNAGENAFVQFHCEEPIALAKNDRFIIRHYSTMEIMGGGKIIDPKSIRHKRHKQEVIEMLIEIEEASESKLIAQILLHTSDEIFSDQELAARIGYPLEYIKRNLDELISANIIIQSAQGHYLIHRNNLENVKNKIVNSLLKIHSEEPLRLNIPVQDIRNIIANNPKLDGIFHIAMAGLGNDKRVYLSHNTVRLIDHNIRFTEQEGKIKDSIEVIYLNARARTPSIEEVIETLGADVSITTKVIAALKELDILVSISRDVIMHSSVVDKIQDSLKKYLVAKENITVSDFCKLADTSRKYGIPLLSYFDRIKFTERIGDVRVLNQ